MDLESAQQAMMEWMAADGCGCCAHWEKVEAAQRKLAEALDLIAYTNYADELVVCRPEDVLPVPVED